jgi:nicotinamidase-related amidase
MQVGILEQIGGQEKVIQNIREVLQAAREAGVRTYFTRHVTLPVCAKNARSEKAWPEWPGPVLGIDGRGSVTDVARLAARGSPRGRALSILA